MSGDAEDLALLEQGEGQSLGATWTSLYTPILVTYLCLWQLSSPDMHRFLDEDLSLEYEASDWHPHNGRTNVSTQILTIRKTFSSEQQ